MLYSQCWGTIKSILVLQINICLFSVNDPTIVYLEQINVICFLLFLRYLFNDAEVKPFDQGNLGIECFGGEMTVSHLVIYMIFL